MLDISSPNRSVSIGAQLKKKELQQGNKEKQLGTESILLKKDVIKSTERMLDSSVYFLFPLQAYGMLN